MDIRIIGGGFAGVVTALTLMDRVPEARVTIYEREVAAHTTLCGEGLSDDTLRMFKAFDSRPYIADTFEDVSWFFPEHKEVRVHQRGHTMARERWIPAMAEACLSRGAEYRTGAKVSAEMVEEMAREADLVVGADGPGSVTRKVVGGRHETMLGIQYRVAREGSRVPERLEFYTDKAYSPEYSWVFPRGDIMNVGLLATGDGHDWERLDRFMKEKQVTGKVLKREAYPIGFFGDTVQKGNVVLVGDAAGLTNPITKGGMAAVVHAADVLASCVAEGNVDAYGPRIAAHPLTERSFAPALAALRRWSNEDYARLTKRAPDVVHVRPGASTERRYAWPLLWTLLANLDKARDVRTVARAMGVSRRYSW
jgi:flavin-dependent dehydrogenase